MYHIQNGLKQESMFDVFDNSSRPSTCFCEVYFCTVGPVTMEKILNISFPTFQKKRFFGSPVSSNKLPYWNIWKTNFEMFTNFFKPEHQSIENRIQQ